MQPHGERAMQCYLCKLMLQLKKLTITHFKNYEISSFEFPQKATGISGLNGHGKTNLLDAIYYCCFTKSYFTPTDSLNTGFGKNGFRLEALFEQSNQSYQLICINRDGKKELLLNGIAYDKLSKHIGLLPAVMVAPDDIEIITGGSGNRRKYLDTILCQLDADYLQQLMNYNRVLLQRNSLLKNFNQSIQQNELLLQVLDDQLTIPGNLVFEKRKTFNAELLPLVSLLYEKISGTAEQVSTYYESDLKQGSMESLLKKNREKDKLLQRTVAGIHKDDLSFTLNDQPFKSIASQGQRKSLLFALKLAEFELIKKYKGFSPILLLDDVFEKLDNKRIQNLLEEVCREGSGQVFITDTHKDRLQQAFELLQVEGTIIEL